MLSPLIFLICISHLLFESHQKVVVPSVQEGLKNAGLDKLNIIIKGIKKAVRFFKSLIPRLKIMRNIVHNLDRGNKTFAHGVEISTIAMFDWFQNYVKILDKKPYCFFYYMISCVLGLFLSIVDTFFWIISFITGFNMSTYTRLIKKELKSVIAPIVKQLPLSNLYKDLGIEYCYRLGPRAAKQIDQDFNKRIPRIFHNSKVYYKRADCGFKKLFS